MPAVDLIVMLQASKGHAEKLRDMLVALRDANLQEPDCLAYRVAQGEPSNLAPFCWSAGLTPRRCSSTSIHRNSWRAWRNTGCRRAANKIIEA